DDAVIVPRRERTQHVTTGGGVDLAFDRVRAVNEADRISRDGCPQGAVNHRAHERDVVCTRLIARPASQTPTTANRQSHQTNPAVCVHESSLSSKMLRSSVYELRPL